ncbi:unnamed protein product [Pseudo-nitzschia multistriata]|uniref:Uncharacterized protein n=1 Tax=Pseudo-nitzschia multistriata TaxID=183589 RepID=A0A448ZEB5_9STRA|nr:unnamed protein product [Pseudo-nitzschia multistriata]
MKLLAFALSAFCVLGSASADIEDKRARRKLARELHRKLNPLACGEPGSIPILRLKIGVMMNVIPLSNPSDRGRSEALYTVQLP